MSAPLPFSPNPDHQPERSTPEHPPEDGPKIYLLPNLMTAGNLICGFLASLKIVEGSLIKAAAADNGAEAIAHAGAEFISRIHFAIGLILASCVFDLLDGRLARLGGTDSDFGREFDSLADIVSFGVAPALMVYSVILPNQYFAEQWGWIIAAIYLVSGALRLARFNCIAAAGSSGASKEFTGFPIPAAAGLIASLTLFLFWLDEHHREIGAGKWLLPALMIFLAFMMFSKFKYPSFKGIGWRTTRSLPRFGLILLGTLFVLMNLQWMPFVIFLSYLLYGFLRPFLSRKMKQEIEDEPEEDSTF